jgi:hypothetical protein
MQSSEQHLRRRQHPFGIPGRAPNKAPQTLHSFFSLRHPPIKTPRWRAEQRWLQYFILPHFCESRSPR